MFLSQSFIHSALSIVIFALILTFLIVIHELGHFFVALWSKVRVLEFGFGIPPKVKTLFTWKGIPFTLNALPLGGFVRMDGEDGNTVESGEGRVESTQKKTNHKELTIKDYYPFYQRPLWQKILVVLAGPAVNIIFGMIVFSSLYSLYGIPEEIHIPPTITAISENSPAQKSGIKEDDVVIAISKNDGSEKKETKAVTEVITYVNAHRGETLKLTVNRNGSTQTLDVYARKESEIPAGQGTIGISLSDIKVVPKFYPGLEQLARGTIYGVTQSLKFGKTILVALGGIGSALLSGHIPGDVAGPVGIAHEVQKQDLFASGWATTFNFAALLSINLGVMNLLPIPALDGGRIFLLFLEKFIKHKHFEKISNNLNQFGFLFLIGLLILITIKDVIGLFAGK